MLQSGFFSQKRKYEEKNKIEHKRFVNIFFHCLF